ncbi:MAG: SulP family inorganic anion transporter [Bacteroidota bacterium]|nr:SulP family inorganic anion transporter [Bacteroidota bacterium]
MLNNSNNKIPADGFAGLKENFSKDALSGFLVFLLALPLSLGIAKASDFPAIFGLVTAIIGGVVVSFFSGSRLSIKGPAAGLIVIASGAVSSFGGGEQGWHLTLGAIVVAALIQILFGVFKLGKLADFFPGAAIHGMLAAIGIIIISKQIHTLLGIDPALLKGKAPLELLAMIPQSIMHENAHISEIGISCLVILILFSFVKNQKIKKIPAPLVVLLVAIPFGIVLHIKTEGAVANFALVKIGSVVDAFKGGIMNANFSGITSHTSIFIEYVILFALIGSLESLLTAKAIDLIDPYKRKSNFNKDLIAIGIGNSIAGLLGGLPMISEVARSSANVSNGARTRWANFFHGLFLLLAIVMAVPLIEMIPNAALAAMLIYVGFRLAHPKEFKHMLHIGVDQLVIFVVTIIMTLATDLLIGVGSGILMEFIFNTLSGAKPKNFFKARVEMANEENQITAFVKGDAVFSNYLGLKKQLNSIEKGKQLVIDLSSCKLIDHTTLNSLHGFQQEYELEGGHVEIREHSSHTAKGHTPTSTKVRKQN